MMLERLTDLAYICGSLAFATAWQGAVIAIVAVAVLSRWTRMSAATRGACAWVLLIGTVLIPAWVAWPIASAPPESTTSRVQQTVLVIRESIVTGPALDPRPAAGTSAPVIRLRPPIARALVVPPAIVRALVIVWICVTAALLIRLALGVARILAIKRRAMPAPAQLVAMFQQLGARSVAVRMSDDFPAPVVVGYLRPMVLLPRTALHHLDDATLRHVMLHELAHVRRGDPWAALALRTIRAVLFPLPGIHIIARRLEIDQELACDEWALARGGANAMDYVRSLLQVGETTISARGATRKLAPAAATQLRRRVESLLRGTTRHAPRHWWSRGAFAGAAFAAALVPLSAFAPALMLVRFEAPSHAQDSVPVPEHARRAVQKALPSRAMNHVLNDTLNRGLNDSLNVTLNDTLNALIGQLQAPDAGARARAAFSLSFHRNDAVSAAAGLIALLGDDEHVARVDGTVSKAWSRNEDREVTSPAEEAAKALLYVGRGALAPVTAALGTLTGNARARAEWVAGLLRNFD